jgi:RNA:NAD 2'-phosphotransferase (TPT1/KptA family)
MKMDLSFVYFHSHSLRCQLGHDPIEVKVRWRSSCWVEVAETLKMSENANGIKRRVVLSEAEERNGKHRKRRRFVLSNLRLVRAPSLVGDEDGGVASLLLSWRSRAGWEERREQN